MRLLVVLLGFLVGLAVACGDAVIYSDCGSPGPHEFILAGSFQTLSQGGKPDTGIALALPTTKTIVIDDAVETLSISYELDGVAVVETFDIVNKRSDYNDY